VNERRPKPPEGLQGAGKNLWEEVLEGLPERHYLPPSQLHILRAAAAQADTNAALEETLTSEGITVRGASGQWRLNAAATELRQGRLALAKLLFHVDGNERVEPQEVDDDFDAMLRGGALIDHQQESS
jgi:hypothetical protein